MEVFEKLEHIFGEWISNPNTVAVSSGTSALHVALEALRLPLGTKVAVPEFTMVAYAREVTMAGLTPFVDCTEDLLINPALIPHDVTVIMPVHIYGREICRLQGLKSRGVGLRHVPYRNDRLHGSSRMAVGERRT